MMQVTHGSGATPGGRLRQLLDDGELIVAPGIFDGLTAHLVRRMGFRAGYLTGAGVAASGFGLPDIGLVGMAEMADRVAMAAGVLGRGPADRRRRHRVRPAAVGRPHGARLRAGGRGGHPA